MIITIQLKSITSDSYNFFPCHEIFKGLLSQQLPNTQYSIVKYTQSAICYIPNINLSYNWKFVPIIHLHRVPPELGRYPKMSTKSDVTAFHLDPELSWNIKVGVIEEDMKLHGIPLATTTLNSTCYLLGEGRKTEKGTGTKT